MFPSLKGVVDGTDVGGLLAHGAHSPPVSLFPLPFSPSFPPLPGPRPSHLMLMTMRLSLSRFSCAFFWLARASL